MGMFIHGIAASENIDSSGERISIMGMDISSLAVDGVFNWEHKADQPGQIVGKVLKAKKIFSEQDCEDDAQLEFFRKCGVPYLYVMGELFDDYKESAKEVAGMFRYDADHKETNDKSVMNFSIEGAKIEKQGMDILKSIARKVTLTALPCNKAAVAQMVSTAPKKPGKNDINELFKTEEIKAEIFSGELRKDQPKLTVAAAAPAFIGQTKSGKAISPTAKVHEYTNFSEADHRDAATAHLGMASKLGETDFKQAQFHRNKGLLHTGAANTMMDRAAKIKGGSVAVGRPVAGAAPKIHTSVARPYGMVGNLGKSLDAGSGMAAPSQLVGGAALGKESIVGAKKQKSRWLSRAEQDYKSWSKREEFENFMTKRMPNMTKGEIRAIGQVLALNKSLTLEKALSSMAGLEGFSPLAKAGEDSIFTLILFEGCELHDILHCSHFATDAMTPDTFEKIQAVCDEYFEKEPKSHELEFNEAGELGKHKQKVLFLTDGNPYKDLFDKLDAVAPYKYSKFRPHISVTTNVDEFKGKAASLVISVNGEVKKKYDFK